METLVAVGHHRNSYYSDSRKGNSPVKFGFSPLRGFKEMNCRAFEGGIGLLPSPFQGYGPYGSPVSNHGYGLVSENPVRNCVSESKKNGKSSPILIDFGKGSGGKGGRDLRDGRSLSERWAGPAYSNSPPPSSLPMPKFDMKPKRTVSLELPEFVSELSLPPMAKSKSAPTSPTSKSARSSVEFFSDDDSATKTLRRILNLDIIDD